MVRGDLKCPKSTQRGKEEGGKGSGENGFEYILFQALRGDIFFHK